MTTPDVLVLGLGNPLLGDDGIGLALLDELARRGPWPPEVELCDGGTWGLSLLPSISRTDHLLVLDAVRSHAAPGTVRWACDDAVPRLYAHPVSPHQVDLREVLAAAELLGTLPHHLAVVGIEPLHVDRLHLGLSSVVQRALPAAAEHGARIVRQWCQAPAPVDRAG